MDELAHYRGLVFKTATMLVGLVEDDFDDIVQVLWIKVWRAHEAYDEAKVRNQSPESLRRARDRFVFSCMTNQVKDLKSKRRRGELSLELVAGESGLQSRDIFDAQYLSVGHEVVYGEVEEPLPLLPNTLTDLEAGILSLLTEGYRQTEAARELGIEKREMERAMRSIRSKMADWKPTTGVPVPSSLPLAA